MARTKQGKALLVLGTIVVVGTGVFLYSRKAKAEKKKEEIPKGPHVPSGGRQSGDPEVPGSGEIVPGKNNEGPPPLPKGWGGGQYGPGPIPKNFDWNGNLVYISADCKTIAEGWLFLPIPGFQFIENWWMPVNGGPSAQGTLAEALTFVAPTGETGTAWGYIARLVALQAREGTPIDLEDIARKVFAELLEFQAQKPNCPDLFAKRLRKSHPGFAQWRDYFVDRLAVGVDAFYDNWYFWNENWEV